MEGISIVIPMHNEERFISHCLSSVVKAQTFFNLSSEIIVVDNNSTDNSKSIAGTFPCNVIECDVKSPAAVRNAGAQLAKYRILAFIDGDCVVPPNWLCDIYDKYDTVEDLGAIGGEHIAPLDANWVVKALYPTEIRQRRSEPGKLPGGNFTVKKDVFDDLKGFDSALISAEDDEFSERISKSVNRIIYDSSLTITHLGYPDNLVDVYKRQVWHGSSQFRAHGLVGDKMVMISIAYMLSFLAALLSLPFSLSGSLFFTLMFFFCAVLVGLNFQKNKPYVKLTEYIFSFIIANIFLAGRCVGLIKELTSRLQH